MSTTNRRIFRGLIILVLAAAGVAWGWNLRAAQTTKFDKLNDTDRKVFAERFEKEIWPLMNRNGKKGCIGCHVPGHISSLRFKDKEPDKVFKMLLGQGFFLPNDVGAILYKVEAKAPEDRMPKDGPAWTAAEIETLKKFVQDLDKKQQKKKE